MLFVYLIGAHGAASFFPSNQLPAQRTITLTNSVYSGPLHFGPVGTFAWENFIVIRAADFPKTAVGVSDCFCAGDNFILHITDLQTGVTERVGPADITPSVSCYVYNEDLETCQSNLEDYSFVYTEFTVDKFAIYNITVEVAAAPYGGGLAYFFQDLIP